MHFLSRAWDIGRISGKFVAVASRAYEKVNTAGTDENLFRLVPLLGHGVRVLPLELVPVHGAQISARAPTEGYVETGASARAFTVVVCVYFESAENTPNMDINISFYLIKMSSEFLEAGIIAGWHDIEISIKIHLLPLQRFVILMVAICCYLV